MNLYIADMHLGHKNSINFDHRPFADIEEMDRLLIANWNEKVDPDDEVYIVGDFAVKTSRGFGYYLSQLKGRKHLIVGNHDEDLLMDAYARSSFESVHEICEVEDTLDNKKVMVTLCHYPLMEWNRIRHGAILVYGHIHADNRKDIQDYYRSRAKERAFNAGCMINNYTPCTLLELRRHNRIFYRWS